LTWPDATLQDIYHFLRSDTPRPGQLALHPIRSRVVSAGVVPSPNRSLATVIHAEECYNLNTYSRFQSSQPPSFPHDDNDSVQDQMGKGGNNNIR
jgi:hypothetical protein